MVSMCMWPHMCKSLQHSIHSNNVHVASPMELQHSIHSNNAHVASLMKLQHSTHSNDVHVASPMELQHSIHNDTTRAHMLPPICCDVLQDQEGLAHVKQRQHIDRPMLDHSCKSYLSCTFCDLCTAIILMTMHDSGIP